MKWVQGGESGSAHQARRHRGADALEAQIEGFLRELLVDENRAKLEQYRAYSGTNRIYKVPLDSNNFVVVKLPPGRWRAVKAGLKWRLRNMMYGERGVSIGSRPVEMEKARYREWAQAGLRTPRLMKTSLPGVRVIEGLDLPTFSEILRSVDEPLDGKLEALKGVTRSLSHQHQTAFEKGQKCLIHSDPGPPNILFDRQERLTYWFDLEYPSECPGMTLHDLAVRSMRIFIYGVMDWLDRGHGEASRIIATSYASKAVLREAAESMESRTIVFRAAALLGIRRRAYERHKHVACDVRDAVADAEQIAEVRGKAEPVPA